MSDALCKDAFSTLLSNLLQGLHLLEVSKIEDRQKILVEAVIVFAITEGLYGGVASFTIFWQ